MNAARLTQDSQRTPTPRFTPGTIADRTIADQLRQRLLALEYPAFARCICVLLEALGYEEAVPAGRREWKGYNRPGGGGYDLEAVLPGGLASRRVIAQIKQFDGLRVHQRSVDELRGACLRAGAAEAILVTTSSFSRVVQNDQAVQNAQVAGDDPATRGSACALFAPVRLIDAKELLTLLICHRLGVRELGVRECGTGAAKRLKIDEAFFHALSNDTQAKDHKTKDHKTKECTQRRAPLTPPRRPFLLKRSFLPSCYLPRWRVTIQISPKPNSSQPISVGRSPGRQGLMKDEGLTEGGR